MASRVDSERVGEVETEARPSMSIKTRVLTVKKGLTRAKALEAAVKKSRGDFRGFKYNPKTGRATLT